MTKKVIYRGVVIPPPRGRRSPLARAFRDAIMRYTGCPYRRGNPGCNCKATERPCIRGMTAKLMLPDMSGTTVSATGTTIMIECGDHNTKDALLKVLTR